MLPEEGQSCGTELAGQELFSCFMSNFNPLPGWPLAFSFFFFFIFNNFKYFFNFILLFPLPSKITSP